MTKSPTGETVSGGMRKRPAIIVAAAAALMAVSADMAEANLVPQRSEAELLKAADLAVVAYVVETGITVNSAHFDHYMDEQGVFHVSGFSNPCIRARVIGRMKGSSASTILVCTPLHAEASALPARGRSLRMYLQQSGEVWLEVLGQGFRETQSRPQ